MKAILVMPKSLMVLALLLAALSSIIYFPSSDRILVIILAVATALISDLIFTKVRGVPPFLMSAALVSGLIIGLLVSPSLPWYIPVVAATAAMGIKNFFRVGDNHIFNPAASGLLVAHLIFNQHVSWWGVSWQQSILPVAILLTPVLVSAYYLKRYSIILPFLLVYAILNRVIFDPTVIFFAIVMLPEPKTSPNELMPQIAFGSLVALGSSFILFADPLITSLLLANLLFYLVKNFKL
ncbi:RnfABCDGE type electron transport complex subunit D [Candidatus Daviesbacteria bacterium]|nr:RnfABCDGE type electron transport complex subunit D [Candidatus Daviesbacteria bacterium]